MAINGESRRWKEIILPASNIWSMPVAEIWRYRDLLIVWMQRDINSIYKQTILGPIWFVIQPILTTITYFVIFTRIGQFSTTGIPPFLFYFSGIIIWSYFSESVIKASNFFKDSSAVISKVYFPKLIIPISIVLTNLVKLGIQFILFLAFYFYYLFYTGTLTPNISILLLPLLLLMVAGLALSLGVMISSLTTRYKDLSHLINFGVQLAMFVSPVFFPLTSLKDGPYKTVIMANPLSGIIEAFRYGFTGKGSLNWELLGYDFAFLVVSMILSIIVFNSIEKNAIDSL